MEFTILSEARAWRGDATRDGDEVRLDAAALESALGFRLEPRGLCRDGVCLPTSTHEGLVTDAGVGVAKLAAVLGRPLSADWDAGVASLADSPEDQRSRLESLDAPDFELSDLVGKRRRLSEFRGKKVLLHAFASW